MNIIRIVFTMVLITVGVILINDGCMPTSPQEKSVTLDNIQGMWYLSEYTYNSSTMDTTVHFTETDTWGYLYITETAVKFYSWDRVSSPEYVVKSYVLNGSILYVTYSGTTVAYTLSFRGEALIMVGSLQGFSVTSTYTPYRSMLPPPGWPVN